LSNLIVLRTRIFRGATFSEILQRVRKTVIEAYEYQELPFMKLYEFEIGPPGDIHPSVTFNYVQASEQVTQSAELEERFSRLPGLTINAVEIPDVQGPIVSAPGMAMHMVESGGALEVGVSYEIERYEATVIDELLANYRILLEDIIHHPNRQLSAFSLSIGGQ
jgi:non-ribosomal peptide synthetase component F